MSTSGSKTDLGSPAISDLELMRYLDGELDEPELAALEARLEADGEASDKLAGLVQVGDFLRQAVGADDRGDAIVDAVMASIDGSAEHGAEDGEDAADAGAEVIELARAPKLDAAAGAGVQAQGPANDNARLIYTVFGAAAAVAIGLFIWGSGGSGMETVAMDDRPAAATEAAAPEVAPVAAAAQAARARAEREAAADEEDEPVVEIATVDFGAQSGSVFYVSAGKNTAGSTAVVWVTDLGD